jgi:hypothetical protein
VSGRPDDGAVYQETLGNRTHHGLQPTRSEVSHGLMGNQHRPLLRVVKGDPTPEELAAQVVVVAARRSAGAEPPRRRPVWGHPRYAMRREHRAGPGAWRASGLPR